MLSIEQYIERHAQNTPQRVAMVLNGEEITYGELHQRTMLRTQHYQGMQRKGVVLRARCDADFLISYFAVHVAGAVAVLLPATATPEQVGRMEKALQGFDFPEGSADVLFTTGTTGTPKGVVVGMRAITASADNIVHGQRH